MKYCWQISTACSAAQTLAVISVWSVSFNFTNAKQSNPETKWKEIKTVHTIFCSFGWSTHLGWITEQDFAFAFSSILTKWVRKALGFSVRPHRKGLDLQPDNFHHHVFDIFSLNCISILLLLCRGGQDKQSVQPSPFSFASSNAWVVQWKGSESWSGWKNKFAVFQKGKKKEEKETMEIFLMSKADFFGHPMATPRGRGEGVEGVRVGKGRCGQLVAASAGCWASLLLPALLRCCRPSSSGFSQGRHLWLVSFFFWWAPLTTGQRQPWSKQGWETPDTVFCSAVMCALHPTSFLEIIG